MRLGDREVRDGWVDGRTVVLAKASVVTMGREGDFVGDIVIRDGLIVAVGVDAGVHAADDALGIDASDAVAIPGLVDSHVHAWEGALRAGFERHVRAIAAQRPNVRLETIVATHGVIFEQPGDDQRARRGVRRKVEPRPHPSSLTDPQTTCRCRTGG